MNENFLNLITNTAKYREEKEKLLSKRDAIISTTLYKKLIKGVYDLQTLINRANKFLGINVSYSRVLTNTLTDFSNSYYKLVFYVDINKEELLQLIITHPKIGAKGLTIELILTNPYKRESLKSTMKFNYNKCYKHIHCIYHEIDNYFKIPKLKDEQKKLSNEVNKLNEEISRLEDKYKQNMSSSY